MSKKLIATFVFCALALPAGARAGTSLPSSYAPEQTRLTWDDLKDACVHPMNHGNQLPPASIHVECNDSKTGWRLSSSVRSLIIWLTPT